MTIRWSLSCGMVALGLFLSARSDALAGEVYGRITVDGASVGAAASVAAQCGKTSYEGKSTDKTGTYHLIIGQSGKCTLTVTHKGGSAGLDIVSQEDAVQYDIDLSMKDGKLTARRR
jgi:hypothetical protein